MDGIADFLRSFFEEYGVPVALGAHGASVLARNAADKKVRQAQDRLAADEMARQQSIADEARAVFQKLMPQVDGTGLEARRVAEQQRLEQQYAPTGAPSGITQNYMAARSTEPQVVGDTIAARVGEAITRGQDHARNAALARSFGSANSLAGLDIARAGQAIGRAGRDSQRSAQILDLEMAETLNKGQGLRTVADAFGLVGDVGGNMGLRKRPVSNVLPGGVGNAPY